jgi:putative ABC transport system permease protein
MTTGIKLLRSPREIPAMVIALAVGVGLTVTVYSLIDAVLLTPLPYGRPEGLVQIWRASSGQIGGGRALTEPDQAALAAAPSAFQGLASYAPIRLSLQRDAGAAPVQIGGALVSTNLFEVLGARPAVGRAFEADDSVLRETPPIVMSERLLRAGTISGGSGGAIGGLLRLDGVSYRLIGIMPEAFWFPDRQTNYWMPLPSLPSSASDANPLAATVRSFPVVARLADGVNRAAAEAQANARLSTADSPRGTTPIRVEIYASILAAPVRPALLVLQVASGLLLLLVCLNVGWLFAARARRLLPVFATMRALGASPAQVLGTHLVSAVCVAAIAVPCAVLIAWMLLRFAMTLETGIFSRTAAPAITWSVISVAFIATVVAGVVSCLPGALTVARWKGNLTDIARTPPRDRRLEGIAMVAQVGLVFAAGAQAVLVALVLWSLSRTNVGLANTDFVVVSLAARTASAMDPAAQLARYKLLLDRLERRGIRAAMANIFPLIDSDRASTFEPRRSREQQRAMVRTRIVTPSYFQITGMTATSGRLLTQADAGSQHIVVTDAFAAQVLRSHDVLGARTGNRGEFTVVGVAPPVRQFSITEEARPEAYILYDDFVASQSTAASALQHVVILAETPSSVSSTLSVIRQEIASQLPDVEIRAASHMRDLIDVSLGVNRLVAAGSIVFAGVALLLAGLGVYAMVSHGLERRRRELGIRIALGATGSRVVVESVRPIAFVYAGGVLLGIALLLSARSAIQSVMVPPPGVAYPPLSIIIGTTAAVLLAVLIAACYRPVKSAADTDPAVSLRVE